MAVTPLARQRAMETNPISKRAQSAATHFDMKLLRAA